jgi:hypothetical protein
MRIAIQLSKVNVCNVMGDQLGAVNSKHSKIIARNTNKANK